jgi:hypothetical protein
VCLACDLAATAAQHDRHVAFVEVIYVVAATLWIFVVLSAVCIGCRLIMKIRARRRRMTRLLRVARPYAVTAGNRTAVGLRMLLSEIPGRRR